MTCWKSVVISTGIKFEKGYHCIVHIQVAADRNVRVTRTYHLQPTILLASGILLISF
jgi:hypothetical protein